MPAMKIRQKMSNCQIYVIGRMNFISNGSYFYCTVIRTYSNLRISFCVSKSDLTINKIIKI